MLPFRSRRRGATLFELLPNVFICGTLLVILIPVFGRARKNARRSQCQANLRQIMLAVSQYMNDNEGYFPPAVLGKNSPNDARKSSLGWADTIQPYLKSTEVYQCPEESSDGSPDPANVGYIDYWYNSALSWNGKHGEAARWNATRNFESVSQLSSTVMMGDAGKAGGMGTATSRCNGYECSANNDVSSPSTYASAGKVGNRGFADGGLRHLDGLNIGYADGHIKWHKSTGSNSSDQIYNLFTPLAVSGNASTFNVKRLDLKPVRPKP